MCILNGSRREEMIQELQFGGLGKHFWRDKTYTLASEKCFWPKMRRVSNNFDYTYKFVSLLKKGTKIFECIHPPNA